VTPLRVGDRHRARERRRRGADGVDLAGSGLEDDVRAVHAHLGRLSRSRERERGGEYDGAEVHGKLGGALAGTTTVIDRGRTPLEQRRRTAGRFG
jgi:hypothetical protein